MDEVHFSSILGYVSGAMIMLTGILVFLRVGASIFSEANLIILSGWHAFIGALVLIFTLVAAKNKTLGNALVIGLGFFEVFVFVFQNDFVLTTAPFLAMVSGMWGLLKENS